MNLVVCGPIATPVPRAAQTGTSEWIPMGRPGEPREVADAAVFLASPLLSYISGQSLVVDGGATAVGPFPHSARRHPVGAAVSPPSESRRPAPRSSPHPCLRWRQGSSGSVTRWALLPGPSSSSRQAARDDAPRSTATATGQEPIWYSRARVPRCARDRRRRLLAATHRRGSQLLSSNRGEELLSKLARGLLAQTASSSSASVVTRLSMSVWAETCSASATIRTAVVSSRTAE
jgi:Enoyl-(Acyl carrier protein) reductase